jgi:hypothetical protein
VSGLTDTLLRWGVLISTGGALLQLVLMIVGLLLPVRWYWGGAIAFFAAPVAFALTQRLIAALPSRVSTDA